MRLLVILLGAVGLGCSGPAKQPTTPDAPKVPGLVWATEARPWHLPRSIYGRAVAGDVAMYTSGNGWITKLDLKTGKVLADKRVAPDDVMLYDVDHLGNDKWIAVGLETAKPGSTQVDAVAYTFDGATLEGTRIPLSVRPDKGHSTVYVAVTPEGVVIGGRGLQLVVYDPATWKAKSILDPAVGWTNVKARGAIVLAANRSGVTRFDLSTNGQRKLVDRAVWHFAVGNDAEVVMTYAGQTATVYSEGKVTELPDLVTAIGIDASGKRLVTVTRQEVRVHELPSGEIKKKVPLGNIEYIGKLTAFGSRMLFNYEGVERTFDLDTGRFSTIDDGPSRPSNIAVDPDGTVLVASDSVIRIQNGVAIGREKPAYLETMRTDDTRRYVTSSNGRKSYQVRAFGAAVPIGSWDFSERPSGVYLARDGSAVFDYKHDGNTVLARTKGVNLMTYGTRNDDSEILALDPDGDALVALDGRVAVLGADGKSRATLRVPGCEKTLAWGSIEIGGTRAATYSDAVAIWDRTTGRLIGSADFGRVPGEILFPTKRDEVVVHLEDKLHFWVPGKSMRTLTAPGMHVFAFSKDSKRLAMAFYDGHVAVYDVDGLLATLPAGTQPKAAQLADHCSDRDPLLPDPPEPESVDGVEGGVEGTDPCDGD